LKTTPEQAQPQAPAETPSAAAASASTETPSYANWSEARDMNGGDEISAKLGLHIIVAGQRFTRQSTDQTWTRDKAAAPKVAEMPKQETATKPDSSKPNGGGRRGRNAGALDFEG
jgi:hypothetical protein